MLNAFAVVAVECYVPCTVLYAEPCQLLLYIVAKLLLLNAVHVPASYFCLLLELCLPCTEVFGCYLLQLVLQAVPAYSYVIVVVL